MTLPQTDIIYSTTEKAPQRLQNAIDTDVIMINTALLIECL